MCNSALEDLIIKHKNGMASYFFSRSLSGTGYALCSTLHSEIHISFNSLKVRTCRCYPRKCHCTVRRNILYEQQRIAGQALLFASWNLFGRGPRFCYESLKQPSRCCLNQIDERGRVDAEEDEEQDDRGLCNAGGCRQRRRQSVDPFTRN